MAAFVLTLERAEWMWRPNDALGSWINYDFVELRHYNIKFALLAPRRVKRKTQPIAPQKFRFNYKMALFNKILWFFSCNFWYEFYTYRV